MDGLAVEAILQADQLFVHRQWLVVEGDLDEARIVVEFGLGNDADADACRDETADGFAAFRLDGVAQRHALRSGECLEHLPRARTFLAHDQRPCGQRVERHARTAGEGM